MIAYPLAQVQAVRVTALDLHAGVEVQLVAVVALGLGDQPVEQRSRVAAPARGGQRREVVDVEEPSPGQVVPEPEAGRGDGLGVAVLERADEPVAVGTLNVVDVRDERVAVVPRGAQLADREPRQPRVGRQDLADLAAARAQ